MKKLMIAAAMMIGLAGIANAQQVATPAPKKVVVKPAAPAATAPVVKVNTATKVVTTKPAVKPVAAPAPAGTAKTVVLKKDGTPDKRYKITKQTVPLKKDGTPDKRYKPNKN